MHLGIKNFVGGVKKYLFGDGQYSQNIAAPVMQYYTPSTYASYTAGIFVDPANKLPYGRRITKLWCYDATGGNTSSLYIVKKNSTNSFTVVSTTGNFTTNSTGWQSKDLSAPYDVPETGEYYLAHWHTGYAYYTSGAVACQYVAPQTSAPVNNDTLTTTSGNVVFPPVGYSSLYVPQSIYEQAASYSNECGSGDRRALMGISGAGTWISSGASSNTDFASMISGTTGSTGLCTSGQAANVYALIFDMKIPRLLSEVKIFMSSSVAVNGNWAYYGSNDGSTWTTVSASVALTGGSQYITTINNDGVAYRYYKFCGVDSTLTTNNAVAFYEFNFKVALPPLQNCIVITGAATVAPDATTGAAAFSCQNIVIDGGTLAPSTNCKGLVGFVSGSARCVNGGRIHIDKLGKAGNFGNLTVLDLVPQSLKGKLKPSLAACVVLGEGAAGGRGSTPGSLYPLSGSAAAALQTGGGGGGGSWHQWGPGGNGGKGGPCCGGAGGPGGDGPYSTTRHSSGDYGGPAGQPVQTGNYTSGGAPADPPGTTVVGSVACGNPTGAGGGLLMLFSPSVSLASGCIISADGAAGVGVSGNCSGSGGAGGGCVVIGTLSGGYTNLGTVRASGGDRGLGYSSDYYGSYGGAGSVNTFTLTA